MSDDSVTKSSATSRTVMLVVTYLLIVLMVWVLINFSQEIFALRRQVATLDKLRSEHDVKAQDVLKHHKYYLERTKSNLTDEHRIEDFLQACREISDVPALKSDFVIYKTSGATPPSTHWIYVPKGKHQLQIRMIDHVQGIRNDKRTFSYDLEPESTYRLTLSLPNGSIVAKLGVTSIHEEEVPIVMTMESNHPSFRNINEELPIKVHPPNTLTGASSLREQFQLRFPGETVGMRRMSSHLGFASPDWNPDPKEKAMQLSGFSWGWTRNQGRSLFISIEILSDALPCAAPPISTQNLVTTSGPKIEFAPYSGNGRFEVKREESQ